MAFVSTPNANMNNVYNSVQGLNRAIWDDYYNNYQGRMNSAFNQAFDTDFVSDAKQRVGASYDRAGTAALGMTDDMLRRYGQKQSADQSASTRAQTQLGLEGQKLGALNQAGWDAYNDQQDLQDDLMDSQFQMMASGVGTAQKVGQEALQRQQAYQQYKSQKRKKKLGGVMALGGLIAAPFTGGASLALTGGALGSMF